MKMILTAIALAIGTPAVAQSSAPAEPHAGHAGHHPAHGGHEGKDTSTETAKPCCDKAMTDAEKEKACAKMKSAAPGDPHAGHKMSGQ